MTVNEVVKIMEISPSQWLIDYVHSKTSTLRIEDTSVNAEKVYIRLELNIVRNFMDLGYVWLVPKCAQPKIWQPIVFWSLLGW